MAATGNNSLQLFVDRLMARSVLTEEEQREILALPAHAIRLSKKQDFVHINEETSYAPTRFARVEAGRGAECADRVVRRSARKPTLGR